MSSEAMLRAAEFVVWVLTVAAIVVAVAGAIGYAAGAGIGAKYSLFLVGVLLFGLGSLAIQPASPRKEKRITLQGRRESRLEAAIQRIPPLRGCRLPFDQRVGRDVKLFVTSLVVLGVSASLEFGLGVAA